MLQILAALAPIFLVIAAGFAVRRAGWLADGFWDGAEKLVYYGLFPCLLFRKAAGAPLDQLAAGPVVLTLLGAIAGTGLAVFALRPLLGLSAPAFGSLFQGAIRMNTYVGFAAAAALAGEIGGAVAALCAAIMVPTVNALSIATLTGLHGGADGTRPKGTALAFRIAKGLALHQLILAILAGLALNLAGIEIPPVIDPATEILAAGALPLALLTVGAGLRLSALKGTGRAMTAALVLKLGLHPALAAGIAALVGLEGPALLTVMIFAALPSSASGYHMARRMGGDAPLLAGVISAQTLAAAVSLPLVILLVGSGP